MSSHEVVFIGGFEIRFEYEWQCVEGIAAGNRVGGITHSTHRVKQRNYQTTKNIKRIPVYPKSRNIKFPKKTYDT